jgi:hypothetical protein
MKDDGGDRGAASSLYPGQAARGRVGRAKPEKAAHRHLDYKKKVVNRAFDRIGRSTGTHPSVGDELGRKCGGWVLVELSHSFTVASSGLQSQSINVVYGITLAEDFGFEGYVFPQEHSGPEA